VFWVNIVRCRRHTRDGLSQAIFPSILLKVITNNKKICYSFTSVLIKRCYGRLSWSNVRTNGWCDHSHLVGREFKSPTCIFLIIYVRHWQVGHVRKKKNIQGFFHKISVATCRLLIGFVPICSLWAGLCTQAFTFTSYCMNLLRLNKLLYLMC
jgi:hypothetical protein